MVIASAPTSKDFELAPEGNHIANCYRIIDLGTQTGMWNGQPTKPKHKINITWELPSEPMEDGKPFSITKRYTVSLHENAELRKDLESWRGRKFNDEELAGFDLSNVLGKACMLNVAHLIEGDKTYSNVVSIAPLPKGFSAASLVNPIVNFDLGNFNRALFDSLSDGIKNVIAKSSEYQSIVNAENGIPL